jgi:hypothetical protein
LAARGQILMTFSDHARELLTKHFDAKLKLCQKIQESKIVTVSESTQENIAGILTKPLARNKHRGSIKEFGIEIDRPSS